MTRMEETEALRARTDVHYNCCPVTGALMVLGLAGKGADEATALMRRFREKNQVLDCANLLRLAKERGEERKCHCDRMVYEAVELLEDLLK